MNGRVYLRDVRQTDLPHFFAHQNDPIANKVAAFPARDLEAFTGHWRHILADDEIIKRTIVHDELVAGNVLCYRQSETRLIGYWLGRNFWGQGIATSGVSQFILSISLRPLLAHVTHENVASRRVLEKCGFKCTGENVAAASTS